MMIYYLDCDCNGTDSIQDILDANPKEITYMNGGNFERADSELAKLSVAKGDLLIVDTISGLGATLRRNAKFIGLKDEMSVWAFREKWLGGDKNYLTVYDMAEQMILERLKSLKNKGMNILVLAHENKQINERTLEEAIGPELPPAFYRRLNEACSDMFRLSILMEDEKDSNGNIKAAEGTRVLTLKPTADCITKYHVSFEKAKTLPKRIINPTIPKIHKVLGKVPSFMCLFGCPGAGKTTLSLSQFLEEKPK
jgi:hypothetical protein